MEENPSKLEPHSDSPSRDISAIWYRAGSGQRVLFVLTPVVAISILCIVLAYLLSKADSGAEPTTESPGNIAVMETTTPTLGIFISRPLPPTPQPYLLHHAISDRAAIDGWSIFVPFPYQVFQWQNFWFRDFPSANYRLTAYAGGESLSSPGSDPYQGLLVLVTQTFCCPEYSLEQLPVYSLMDPEIYRTPLKTGPVQIVWADERKLLMVSADDTAYLFDVITRKWLWPPVSATPSTSGTINNAQYDDQAFQTRMIPLFTPYLTPVPVGYGSPVPQVIVPPYIPPTAQTAKEYQAGAGTMSDGYVETAGDPLIGSNTWSETLIDRHVHVDAGYERDRYGGDLQQGVIWVSGCPGGGNGNGIYSGYFMGGGWYETPIKVGGVRVVGATGEQVRLTSNDGTAFVFDVGSCYWRDPSMPTPTAPVPTITSTLSPTPWYDDIETPETKAYAIRMEQLAATVLVEVTLTPGAIPPTPTTTPLSEAAGAGVLVRASPTSISLLLSPKKFYALNYWYEDQGEQRITVYAGVEGSEGNRVQGVIVVISGSGNRQGTPVIPQYYRTPDESGYIEVVGAEGERLRLKASNGADYVFDVANRRWLAP
jgi:hypothetical protein